MPRAAAVLVPVKSFVDAKSRLAHVLPEPARRELARRMASSVLAAAAPLPVTVVCDDDEVASWASSAGHAVVWAHAPGLDVAVRAGIDALSAGGADVAVVAHADLPFAERLYPLLWFEGITLVPDRRDDGTNVAVVPIPSQFRFAYGAGSFRRHAAEARRLGVPLRIARIPRLQWDVDTADDLPPAADEGGREHLAAPEPANACR